MWIVLLVVIGVLVYFLMQNAESKPTTETPLEVLKKRYARGEITKEEFEEMKRSL